MRLREGAFGEDQICHYSRQLLSGVSYLHRKGVAHRDLKGELFMAKLGGFPIQKEMCCPVKSRHNDTFVGKGSSTYFLS